MKDSTVKYKEYLKLSTEEKSEVDFWLEFGVYEDKDYLSDIDISDREFIIVKQLQDALVTGNNDRFAELLGSIKEYSEETISERMTYEVVVSFKFIINKLVRLLEVENEMLSSPANQFSDLQEQIDFSMFPSYYHMLNRLTSDITKFEAICQMKYSDIITQLIYLKKEDELNELVAKRNLKK